MRQRNQKVYYSILAICYLEVRPAAPAALPVQPEHICRGFLQEAKVKR